MFEMVHNCRGMICPTENGLPTKASDVSSAVPLLVDQLRTELSALNINKQEIRQRIQRLRRVIRCLQEVAKQSICGESNSGLDASPPNQGDRVSEECSISVSQPGISFPRRKARVPDLRLMRACRIALIEASPASLEEIQARIARRESFPIPSPAWDRSALRRVLHVMTQDGEVRLLNGPRGCRWERVPPSNGDRVLQHGSQFSHRPSGQTVGVAGL